MMFYFLIQYVRTHKCAITITLYCNYKMRTLNLLPQKYIDAPHCKANKAPGDT